MRAGNLRHPVVIQENTPTRSSTGANVDAWATFASVRARIEPMRGREYVGSEQLTDETTHKFTIRYCAGVAPKMRISWDGRLFDIQSVINHEERNREMFLMAVEHDS